MRYFILLVGVTLALAAPQQKGPLNPRDLGSYKFIYSTDSEARSEDRAADGSTRGAYTYVDDEGVIHEVQYVASPESGFKVLAHNIKGEPNKQRQGKHPNKYNETAESVELVDGLTPEVAEARRFHERQLAAWRKILPEVHEDDGFVPDLDPERRRALEQPVPVPPLRQNFVHISKVEAPVHRFAINRQDREDDFDFETTSRPLLGIPPAPTNFQHNNIQDSDPTRRFPKGFPILHRRRTIRDVHPDDLLAVDIKLVDGYTPEVAAARAQHLRSYDLTRASLPQLSEEELNQ